jgi:hypothetical protein
MARMNHGNVSRESMGPAEAQPALRVLVVGADARYRDRAQTVIGAVAGVGFAHVAPTGPDDVWWLVKREQAEVVVLDATDCEAAVTEVIARLAAVAPKLGVVVVCEHLTNAARELHALPKWGWTSELRAAVQRARLDGSPLTRARVPRKGDRRDLRGVARAPLSRR